MNRPLASRFENITKAVASPHLAKAGLICGGIALAAGALGAALSAIYPHPPGEIETAEQSAGPARLPRARPAVPVATGSINPTAAAAEGADALSESDAAEAQRLEQLRAKAILVAGSRAECGHVIDTELLENRPLDLVVVLVRCGNGIRIYLDEVDIEASSAKTAPRPEEPLPAPAADLTDAQAIRDCEDKVRRGLAQPASLSRLTSSTGIDRVPGGDAIVTFDFNALNGLGFPLAMQAQCVFSESQLARLEVAPR